MAQPLDQMSAIHVYYMYALYMVGYCHLFFRNSYNWVSFKDGITANAAFLKKE